MTTYVALLRGIGPSNPNMHGAKLREFFEGLGFTNVTSVISSGNVVFKSSSKNPQKLEEIIEKALPEKLGFNSTTIIRSKEYLEALVKKDPFKGKQHSRESYLTVTFFKNTKSHSEIFNKWNMSTLKGPEFMVQLEKKYGKEMTTRTWKTVERILKKMI